MNYLDLYSSYPDQTIVAAWNRVVRAAENIPALAAALMHCRDDIFSRFADVYAELRALPRGARRLRLRLIATSCEFGPLLSPSQQKPERHLRRKLTRSLAGAALLMALSQGTAAAATITVTTKDPNIRPDGKCSLIEAIVNANSDTPFFPDCPAGSGSD